MSDQDQTQADGQPETQGPRCRRRRRRGWLGYIVAGLVGAAIGAGALGWGFKHMVHAGWRDEARFERFVDRGLDRMLDRIDASAEQRAQVRPILTGAARDMRGFAQEMRDSRGAVVAALTGETVDRAGLESLRAARIAALDSESQRVLAALAEAAEKLTPAQRAELADRFARRHY